MLVLIPQMMNPPTPYKKWLHPATVNYRHLSQLEWGKESILVGGFNPFEKILVKFDHFPRDRDENKKSLKPPPSINCTRLSLHWSL